MNLLKNKTIQNGLWLYVLQFVNTVLPMLTIPYVTRMLGAEQYGYYSLALNWTTYLHVIVTYGFDMVGSRFVAQNKDDSEKIKYYVSSVVSAKLLLTLLSAFILTFLLILGDFSKIQCICTILLFGSVVGESFKQTWLFQGMQTMKNITIISSLARIISTICIFFLVHEDGLFIYCILYSISGLFVGVVGILISRYKLGIRFVRVPPSLVMQRLKEGFLIFTTNVMSKVFTGFGITVLGIVGNATQIGIYSAIYKIPSILVSCFAPISQALYPSICLKYQKDYKKAKELALKIGAFVVCAFMVGSIVILIVKEWVVGVAFGIEYQEHSMLLIPFMIWLCISIANNFLGTQILIASGHSALYSRAFTTGMISLVCLTVCMGYTYQMYGIAYAQVISEAVLLCANIIAVTIAGRNEQNKEIER